MFINAIGESSEKDSPIRDIYKQFKNLMRNHIRDLCVQASAEDPDALADQLALILEGAIVTAQVSQNPDTAKTAKNIGRTLIAERLRQGPWL